ncbi:hypothetical protein ACIA8O_30955 [Kitasatospora sp. NPDC051853]|uniref:hypothetical protein n=1 Tax=Kitasatospora sp. NPDC051853 TaxID=3364058 RepID=UPI0037B5E7E1
MSLLLERNEPLPRLTMVSEFLLGTDFHVGLDRAVFVAAGERIDYGGRDVVVTGPSGAERRYYAGGSHWICRIGG